MREGAPVPSNDFRATTNRDDHTRDATTSQGGRSTSLPNDHVGATNSKDGPSTCIYSIRLISKRYNIDRVCADKAQDNRRNFNLLERLDIEPVIAIRNNASTRERGVH